MPSLRNHPYRKKVRNLMAHPLGDRIVSGLIMISVALLFIEIIDPSEFIYMELGYAVNILFFFELTLRCYGATSRARFLRSYWLDIISLLPLLAPQYAFLRALRLLRIFRLGPLMKQSNRRFGVLYRRTWGEQLIILSIVLVVVVGVTLGLVGSEKEFANLYDAFWWALLSVAAGEPIGATPDTPLGRFFTLIVILGGITIFALFTGTVSAIITERLREGVKSTAMNVEDIEDHVLICGWNRSFKTLLDELTVGKDSELRPVVVVGESNPPFSPEQEANPRVFYIKGDYTRVEVLRRAGVERASKAILLADRSVPGRSDQDRDARTILAALLIEKLHPGIFTCAELLSRENEQHLRLAGIEEVVVGDEYSATILATSSRVEGVTSIADEIFSAKFGNQIYKHAIRPEWVGQSFLEVQNRLKLSYDALLIAIEQADPGDQPASSDGMPAPYQRTITNPPASYEFQPGDLVIVFSKMKPAW